MDHLARFDNKVADFQATCAENVKLMLKWKSITADAIGEYEKHGITGPLSEATVQQIKDNVGVHIPTVLKGIADAKGWMFVCPVRHQERAYGQGGYKNLTFTELTIPNLKRTPALASALLLQGQPFVYGSRHNLWANAGQHPVEVETKPRSWVFRFFGTEGDEALARWMDAVRTDSTYRIIIMGLE